MLVKQIKVGSMDNFCYIIGCEKTKQGAVIDPGWDVDMILNEADKLGLTIKYIFNTHNHPDHIGGNQTLKKTTGAKIVMHSDDAQSMMHSKALSPETDIIVTTDCTLKVGDVSFQLTHTPGHTPGGLCYYAEGQLFTGDTLFVGDSGRTDLAGGDRPALGASLRKIISQFPDDTVVWPGHDYGPTLSSTLGWEKKHNVNAREYGFYSA
jgi:hydroxyacylglutathione hydrolase